MGDAAAVAALRMAAGQAATDRLVRFYMRNGRVYVARRGRKLVATLTLVTKKPWSIDRKFMTPVKRPLYLISMAVAPDRQRKGIGRACLTEAIRIARRRNADSLVLDAYDAPGGAGGFYRKCGFRETGRGAFRKVPLVYFELLLSPGS